MWTNASATAQAHDRKASEPRGAAARTPGRSRNVPARDAGIAGRQVCWLRLQSFRDSPAHDHEGSP
ncbi:hypothetical protein HMPREF9154_3139 [Arachnia propionica F0230a]|nr:hypothetical protein HMPREF9154_3139 [Arachnia propionica F0230a]